MMNDDNTGAHNRVLMHSLAVYATDLQLEVVLMCVSVCVYRRRMGTFVTLAEVLEARGSPLDEDEVWCLLLATTGALLDISRKGNPHILPAVSV